ncbi:MAG: hypothetical protein K8U03_19605 [Planctomycetia bacterium]|nr:hypothetical protein [Planctomycetia bacterium]
MSHSSEGANADVRRGIGNSSPLDRLLRQITAEPILSGALASMGLALGLELAGRSKAARFVGLWAPTLLLLGLYRQVARADAQSTSAFVNEELGEDRFQGGCAARPEESLEEGYRMSSGRHEDDPALRNFPHKAK